MLKLAKKLYIRHFQAYFYKAYYYICNRLSPIEASATLGQTPKRLPSERLSPCQRRHH